MTRKGAVAGIVTLGLITIVYGIIFIANFGNSKVTNYEISIKKSDNCNKNKKLYYTDSDGIKYYTTCLDSIPLVINNTAGELKRGLEKNLISFKDIYTDALSSESYWDGGSTIYTYKGFKILKCNKLITDGNTAYNRDVIIGNSDLDIADGYCTNSFVEEYKQPCTFIRTYRIINLLADYQDDDKYSYIVVNQFQGIGPEVVKVSKTLKSKFEKDKFYEFTFSKNKDAVVEDNLINDIFSNYELISTKETDKEGLDQMQEPICKIN